MEHSRGWGGGEGVMKIPFVTACEPISISGSTKLYRFAFDQILGKENSDLQFVQMWAYYSACLLQAYLQTLTHAMQFLKFPVNGM